MVRFRFATFVITGLFMLSINAQPTTTKEPIAFIGHGALFDQNGHELTPTLDFLRSAQTWYRAFLIQKLSPAQRTQFADLERRMTAGRGLDEASQLTARAYSLEWLASHADLKDGGRVRGKIAAMKMHLQRALRQKPQVRNVFNTSPALAGGVQEIVTANGGAAYRAECTANGVPLPPDWGTSGWVSRGQIPSNKVFISKTLQAEVFTYQSASPDGMCIALPRHDPSDNTIYLLGIICLGKTSSKACFFDNDVNGVQFYPTVGQTVPFNNFGGGTELDGSVGGICTDCHAGQNPYIVHPQTVLGTLEGLGLPMFADNWYEPIVQAGWPQNPGPMPSSGSCGNCHYAGYAGHFPHLSSEYPSYCSTILNSAVLNSSTVKTMPPGNPGSLESDPQFTLLKSLCQLGPGGDASTRGDPHLITVDGTPYDFQSAGEFVALRSANDMEIQTRQEPVSSQTTIGPNAHTGLTTCVSVNTAVAARVGKTRVTYQPRNGGQPNPDDLELRIDGKLTALPAQGIDLGAGGRINKTGDGIEIEFPDGARLSAVPGWWGAPHNRWYLNLDVVNYAARQGIMGNLAPGSWLPALPNGTSMGPRPASLHQRYLDLYQKFADAWRVTPRTSLFDYAPRTSTASFTLRSWPRESGGCAIAGAPEAKPLDAQAAELACRAVTEKEMNAQCVFDVRVTGDVGFARTYLASQRLRFGTTITAVSDDRDPTARGGAVTFRAAVMTLSGKGIPTGAVQFLVDGVNAGGLVPLNAKGNATWTTSGLAPGSHDVTARYIPNKDSIFLASASVIERHTVNREASTSGATIPNLPMQGGTEATPCPPLGITYGREDAARIPYFEIMLPGLDKQCATKGDGLRATAVKFLTCAPDPRGKGFGPNATADLTCSK